MMSSQKYRAVPFTINNYTDDDTDRIHKLVDKVQYIVVGKEVGEQGTPHYQGYMYFKTPRHLNALKKLLPRAHFSVPARGTHKENQIYCTKEGDILVESGILPGQGERTDIDEVRDIVDNGGTMIDVVKNARSYQAAKFGEMYMMYNSPKPRDDDFVPWEWQQKVIDIFKHPCDNDRIIHYVYDPQGKFGKSRLCKHLICNYNAISLLGKVADMAYAYNSQPIVIFDIPRTQSDNMTHIYSFAETLKNGIVFSSKFNSQMKVFKSPHVLICSNSPPDMNVWTPDRYNVIQLSDVNSVDLIDRDV